MINALKEVERKRKAILEMDGHEKNRKIEEEWKTHSKRE